MTDRELMQMALDAIEGFYPSLTELHNAHTKTAEALRARLAQPEPEPWGYISHKSWKMPVFVEADDLQAANLPHNNPDYTPVYKTPPQREWQGLTDEEIKEIIGPWGGEPIKGYTRELIDKIEEALRRKNG